MCGRVEGASIPSSVYGGVSLLLMETFALESESFSNHGNILLLLRNKMSLQILEIFHVVYASR